jgi:uncharacterized radical SAM superfamily Fe-S cluster-containing enzyme
MKCCLNFLTPDGRMIPFCTYNSVGYRERITEALIRQSMRVHEIPSEAEVVQEERLLDPLRGGPSR